MTNELSRKTWAVVTSTEVRATGQTYRNAAIIAGNHRKLGHSCVVTTDTAARRMAEQIARAA